MEQAQQILDQILAFTRSGFEEINATQGLLIALAATVFMGSWKQWFPISVLAVIVHIAIDKIAPVLAGQGDLRLPPLMEASFWQGAGVLLAGYLIVIAVFFFAKRMLFRAGKKGH